jgi:hypothetical protein
MYENKKGGERVIMLLWHQRLRISGSWHKGERNYLFPATHVADQLDWKENSSVVDSRLGFNNLIQFDEKIQNFYLYVQFYG